MPEILSHVLGDFYPSPFLAFLFISVQCSPPNGLYNFRNQFGEEMVRMAVRRRRKRKMVP